MLATALALLVLAAPPSGRPPLHPLERYDPKGYELTFEVNLLRTSIAYDTADRHQPLNLVDTPIVMPVIFQGTYSAVTVDSLVPGLWLDGRPDSGAAARFRIDDGFPFQTRLAVIPIASFDGKTLRWSLTYQVQTWSSRLVDENAAAAATWPREWPEEVRDGLQPQRFIESDDPLFAQELDKLSNGRLRLVPPFLAAKDIIRHCVGSIRVTGDGTSRGIANVLQGLELRGARATAIDGLGTPHDLVCVCIAMLRAAGVPARPVIGVIERHHEDPRRLGATFVSWGEFYLPDAGWVPFDPVEMRGEIRSLDVRRPWPELGTMKDLNLRIPLAYHFVPPAAVESPRFAAVWGWDPRPRVDPGLEQQIRLRVTSKPMIANDPRNRTESLVK